RRQDPSRSRAETRGRIGQAHAYGSGPPRIAWTQSDGSHLAASGEGWCAVIERVGTGFQARFTPDAGETWCWPADPRLEAASALQCRRWVRRALARLQTE